MLVVAAPAAATDDAPVEAGIVVKKIENLPEGFMRGVDVSSVLSLEESGVVFRDTGGAPADLFDVLADAGVTDVRVRVWNDPYDAEGNGYGGGDVDVDRAVEIGERATAAGLGVVVDFHYSDFWADPGKQTAPKAWTALGIDDKAAAVEQFTHAALQELVDAGVDVGMVQVGNETNNGVAGTTSWDDRAAIFSAGSAAVRDVLPDALVALHFTNPETAGRYADYAQQLDARGVDYDVFASSYYPFWHGTPANLTAVLGEVAADYGKKVMVAETSWASTLEDGDGHPNTVRAGQNDTGLAYPISVQGQATELRTVMQAVADVPDGMGIGAFYWEPAWLPVGPASQVEQNKLLWEEFGSGWASSYAGEYEDDAAQYYGGSSWDNQALFDFAGNPLESLQTFRYVLTGSTAPRAVYSIAPVDVTVRSGDAVSLPTTVSVTYNDETVEDVPVTWADVLDWVRGPGAYTVHGVTRDGDAVTASLTVSAELLPNGGFETNWGDGWTIDWTNAPVKEGAGNQHGGAMAVNFWSAGVYSFTGSRTVTGLAPGTYDVSMWVHGGDAPTGTVALVATTSNGTTSAPATLAGWLVWSHPTVTAQVGDDGALTVAFTGTDLAGGAWGWIDDVSVVAASDPVVLDTAALDTALAAARAVDPAGYTAESVAALDHAIAVAEFSAAGSTRTQEDVDAITTLLTDALAGLRLVSSMSATLVSSNVTTGENPRVAVRVTASRAPTGTITVDYGTGTKSVALHAARNGVITVALPHLAAGRHVVAVAYSGDRKVAAAAAAPVTLTVVKTPSTVKAALGRTVVPRSETTKVTVMVRAAGVAAPTGKVTVRVGGKTVVAVLTPADKGRAKVQLPVLPAGKYTVNVAYAGDGSVRAGTATPLTLRVR
ncbi:arabinogalactan endo-beta-1,4-galactanase [Cellulomonas composti]|uniref:Arabinogalactan endo-beta-1,4-galactanase n=2 Tax=Cellulomonas composti TaxID=266130 RepID=A0A511JC40_9CELL|nr:arabinogalactan endo-beta-1,4-galactanase [Cellulomonas composti]